MKKVISVFVVCVLVFVSICPAYAAANTFETESQKMDRVKEEILSGNITSDRDVIEVALSEYHARVLTARAKGITDENPENLTITQVLNSETTAGGTVVETVAQTTLLLVDENGNQLSLSDYEYYDQSGSASGVLEDGYLGATMTMYVTTRRDSLTLDPEVSVSRITGQIRYQSGSSASRMTLTYIHHNPYEVIEQDSTYYSNPSLGTTYSFYPDSSWTPKYTYSQLEGDVSIRYGTKTLEMCVLYLVDGGSFAE